MRKHFHQNRSKKYTYILGGLGPPKPPSSWGVSPLPGILPLGPGCFWIFWNNLLDQKPNLTTFKEGGGSTYR